MSHSGLMAPIAPQCLVTTVADIGYIASLFKPHPLAKGEKRPPSGFETFTPVLGHLHGLPEQVESLASSSAVEHPKERKEPKYFARKGARILREWFYQNQEHPYPNEDQKDQLSQETGFSQKRISTWFANARRRQKQKVNVSSLATNSRPRAGSPLVTSTLDSMTPMERWQASPPEDEPVPESVIQDAIADIGIGAGTYPSHFDASAIDLFNFDQVSSHLSSSVSSFGSRVSETSESASSAWSHQSGGHGFSFPLLPQPQSTGRQRGKRASGEASQYQCTFCPRSFRKRHDWSRHEKSVHLSLDTWVCTPSLADLQSRWDSQVGDDQQYRESEVVECHFCDTPFPGPDHWEHHEFHVCADKPLADRTFSRKDYLWQHLRKFHGCTKMPVSDLDAWRAMGVNVQSRCGFCDRSLPTWAARSDHLAEHFKKDGARMEQWMGDWGLDVSAMSALRNAVLPSQRSLMRQSG
ncbi:uncharacterized protein N7459_001485 [Penicillium hispanicum]|uniref:uncharacterized protein n=1 Tax=Penicillium hispanicum TaxID=1080232 RepID=UPI002540D817|nr:uncharacterized protein N7459_001485 [Penicillium hispanicum]KAJ5595277.1 hypothetical protein N7459_001485 [Penicillium hispanicum]